MKRGLTGWADALKQRRTKDGLANTIVWMSQKTVQAGTGVLLRRRSSYLLRRNTTSDVRPIRSTLPTEIRTVSVDEPRYLEGIRSPWTNWHRVFLKRWERGQVCLACLKDNRALGYIWISEIEERDERIGLTIRPERDETYGFDLYVLPEYRKCLIGFELVGQWLTCSRDAGKHVAIGVVETHNKPMLMLLRLAYGFKVWEQYDSLQFLSWRGIVFRRTSFAQDVLPKSSDHQAH